MTSLRSLFACLVLGLSPACADSSDSPEERDDLGEMQGAASESRFADLGEGMVADSLTWLTWQKQSDEGVYTWEGAQNYCAWLYLGEEQWRLPTREELEVLIDSRFTPTIDTSAFPNTPEAQFWTQSKLDGRPDFAWNVDFATGESRAESVNSKLRVRCIRR